MLEDYFPPSRTYLQGELFGIMLEEHFPLYFSLPFPSLGPANGITLETFKKNTNKAKLNFPPTKCRCRNKSGHFPKSEIN